MRRIVNELEDWMKQFNIVKLAKNIQLSVKIGNHIKTEDAGDRIQRKNMIYKTIRNNVSIEK